MFKKMSINKTDKKIAKMWLRGNKDISSLARKIGRPGDIRRIIDGLLREGFWEVLKPKKGD